MSPLPRAFASYLQYSLRSLAIVLTLLALGCAWIGFERHKSAQYQQISRALVASGAKVHAYPPWGGPGRQFRSGWSRLLLGDDSFELTNSVSAGLSSRITDDDIKRIGQLKYLDILDLSDLPVTDQSLAYIGRLVHLTILRIDRARITDVGLRKLSGLTELEILSLDGNGVSDAALELAAGLPNLESLVVSDTRVTDSGLRHLSRLSNLKHLELGGTEVSDSGLRHLRDLVNLDYLRLPERITQTGLKNLQSAIPNCEIDVY